MSAPTVIQDSAAAGTTPYNIVLTGVTAGSTLAAIVYQYNNANDRTYSVSDDINGAWTQAAAAYSAADVCASVLSYFVGSASGTVTITISSNVNVADVYAVVVELTECEFVDSSSVLSASASTTHYCAASGKLDSAGDALIFSGGILHASGGTITPTTGFTTLFVELEGLAQYKSSDAGFTDERSEYSSSTARREFTVSALFETTGGGSALPIILQQLGA